MRLFKKAERPFHTWQYAPYEFESGKKVVIELNASDLFNVEDITKFKAWLHDNGINAHVILTRTGTAIKPVTVKHLTQYD